MFLACPYHDWRHIRLVQIPSRLLLNLDRPAHNHTIVIFEVALAKNPVLRRLVLQLGDLEQLLGHSVRILHEKAKASAGCQIALTHRFQTFRAESSDNALLEIALFYVCFGAQLIQNVDSGGFGGARGRLKMMVAIFETDLGCLERV